MTVYVSADGMPFTLEVSNRDLAPAAEIIRRWVEDGATKVFTSGDGSKDVASYVIRFDRLAAVHVTTRHPDSARADEEIEKVGPTTLFPVELPE
jgi:hypothetical protein